MIVINVELDLSDSYGVFVFSKRSQVSGLGSQPVSRLLPWYGLVWSSMVWSGLPVVVSVVST